MDKANVLIKNGMVLDPANGLCKKCDVAVQKDKIFGIGDFGQEITNFMLDATDCLVVPGLIDHHAHLYPLIVNGLPAEAVCFAAGVTTVVDAGSTGCATYEANRPFIQNSQLRILSYLNVSSAGLASLPILENMNPEDFDVGRIQEMFAKYPQELLGLKIRTSKNIVKDFGFKPLEKTVELAEKIGVPVMVHCTNPPGPIAELLKILRPGDIMTHLYQNIGHTILDETGKVRPEVYKAREKGILFEAADARAHFSFEVSEPAIKEGFLPDIIATDLTKFSMYQRPTSFNLAMQISKYAFLGIDFYEVLRRCTENPARDMGMLGEIGCLSKNSKADIVILKKIEHKNEFGDRPYYDKTRQLRIGNILYKPMLTMKNGTIVYRDMLF